MTSRDIQVISNRLEYWSTVLKTQHSMKKELRDNKAIKQAKIRISILKSWLSCQTETFQESLSGKKEEVKVPHFTKEEFLAQMKSMGLDPAASKNVMEITSRKQIDQMWPWLHRANIQLKMSHELASYFRHKMDLETNRPYKSITK